MTKHKSPIERVIPTSQRNKQRSQDARNKHRMHVTDLIDNLLELDSQESPDYDEIYRKAWRLVKEAKTAR